MEIDLLRTMLRIRAFEMAVNDHTLKGEIPGFAHLYVGEEAIATGVCAALKPDDYITSTHRGHGHCIAKGADLRLLMAELWGRKTGYCKGRGGTMHVYIRELNVLGTNGIVGGGLPLSLGPALHAKLKHTGQVSVCFFGDGACNNGTFHESVNIAAVQDLPLVFVCENNLYATVTSVREATRTENFADRAAGYAIPGVKVDGNDVLSVLEETRKAVARARDGKGPSLLECKTYRHFGHYVGEPDRGYRAREEVARWKKRDPIEMLCKHLEASGIADADSIRVMQQAADTEVMEAVEFARNSEHPDPKSAMDNVWSGR